MLNNNETMNQAVQNNYNSCDCSDVSAAEEKMQDCCDKDEKQRREMMNQIRSLDFAIIELALYLDTHPEDEKALCLHRKYAKEVKDLKDKYQKLYGPLTIYYPCNKWRWLEQPWPWERGNF